MYQYQHFEHNKLAQWMFDFTLKGAIFLNKHKWLYWLLQCTWGLLYNIFGLLVMLILLIVTTGALQTYYLHYYFVTGNNWGGMSLGTGFIVADQMSSAWTEHTKAHEAGHNYQNCIWGPLAIFLIYIPSCIRWIMVKTGITTSQYDSIWFEDNASVIGEHLYNKLSLNLVYPNK